MYYTGTIQGLGLGLGGTNLFIYVMLQNSNMDHSFQNLKLGVRSPRRVVYPSLISLAIHIPEMFMAKSAEESINYRRC